MAPKTGGIEDILALLPQGPTTVNMGNSSDYAAGTQISCDPCACPDNYIYDEVMWRKMVLVLLCRIAVALEAPEESVVLEAPEESVVLETPEE